MINKKYIFLVFIIVFSLFSFFQPREILAVGIISQPIVIQDVMRGQILEKSLQLVNSRDTEIHFDISADGDIAEWVTYHTLGDIEKPITGADVSWKRF